MTTVTRPPANAFTSLAETYEPCRRHSAGRPVRTESIPHPSWPPAPSRPRPPHPPPIGRASGTALPRAARPVELPPVHDALVCVALPALAVCAEHGQLTGEGPETCTRRGGGSSPAASCGWRAGSPSPSRAAWRAPTGRSSSASCAPPEKRVPTPVSPSNARGAPTAPNGSPCGAPPPGPSGSPWRSLWARISRTWARWRPADPGPNSRRASTEPDCAGPEATDGPPPSPRIRRPRTPWRRRESCAGRPSWLPEPRSRSGSGCEEKRPPVPRAPWERAPDGRGSPSRRRPCRGRRPAPRRTAAHVRRGPAGPAPAHPGAPRGRVPRRRRPLALRTGHRRGALGGPHGPSLGTRLAVTTLRALGRTQLTGEGAESGRIPGPLRDAGPHLPPAARASRPRSPSRQCSPKPAAGDCRRRTWRSCFPSRSAASTGCAAPPARTASCRTRGTPDPGGPRRRRTPTGRRCSAQTSSTPAGDPAVTRCATRRGRCANGSGASSGSTTGQEAARPRPDGGRQDLAPAEAGRRTSSTPDCWAAAGTRRACWTGRRPSGWPGCSAPRPSTPAGDCAAWPPRILTTTPSATARARSGRTTRRSPWPASPPRDTRRRPPPCCGDCSTRRRPSTTGSPRCTRASSGRRADARCPTGRVPAGGRRGRRGGARPARPRRGPARRARPVRLGAPAALRAPRSDPPVGARGRGRTVRRAGEQARSRYGRGGRRGPSTGGVTGWRVRIRGKLRGTPGNTSGSRLRRFHGTCLSSGRRL